MMIPFRDCHCCCYCDDDDCSQPSAAMVQLMFQHGVSKHACTGFSFLSYALCLSNDEASHQFGKFSLMPLKKTKAKEFLPIVCLSVCASSNA